MFNEAVDLFEIEAASQVVLGDRERALPEHRADEVGDGGTETYHGCSTGRMMIAMPLAKTTNVWIVTRK